MNRELYMPRLTSIRYLYTEGLNKSKEYEPQSATCILLFHDSVVLLLNLVSEHVGVPTGKREFMEYGKQLVNCNFDLLKVRSVLH